MARRKPHIVIAGNIGVGKSHVMSRLSAELGFAAVSSRPQDNPYLQRFYADPPRSQAQWAFRSQLYFLKDGIRQHVAIGSAAAGCVQEMSVHEHFLVMAHDHRDRGWINAEDFSVLSGLYYAVEGLLTAPDLIVILSAPAQQLHDRARDGVTLDYLTELNVRYRQFADSWIGPQMLYLDVAGRDLTASAEQDAVCEQIISRLPV